MIGIINKPYDFLIINWLITISLIGGTRILIRWLLSANDMMSIRVLIYGGGAAGIQLKSEIEFNPFLFLKAEIKVPSSKVSISPPTGKP